MIIKGRREEFKESVEKLRERGKQEVSRKRIPGGDEWTEEVFSGSLLIFPGSPRSSIQLQRSPLLRSPLGFSRVRVGATCQRLQSFGRRSMFAPPSTAVSF